MLSFKSKLLILIIILFTALGSWQLSRAVYGIELSPEIQSLNIRIQNRKKQLDNIQTQQQQYQAQIKQKENNRITLNNQLSILSDRLAQIRLDINSVNIETSKTLLEIKKIELDSTNLKQKINTRKQDIAALLQSMYRRNQTSVLETLLLNNSLSDFLNQAKYLADTNQELANSVNNLKIQKNQLNQNKLALGQKNKNLLNFKTQLQQKQEDLSYEQQNKSVLLGETDSSEQKYQALIQQGLAQRRQAEADISAAEQLVRQKMSKQDQKILSTDNNTIDWPVPSHIINASFHDPDYPFRKLIGEHSGIDIRAKQGTIIKAAADGYVAKVKFDGTKNYAYIMLIHGKGLSTVYGHVSAVFVTTDQYVSQGEPIGRTGGTPGTVGSGPFTTGPHLHFEVRLNGIPVNPMNYLP